MVRGTGRKIVHSDGMLGREWVIMPCIHLYKRNPFPGVPQKSFLLRNDHPLYI